VVATGRFIAAMRQASGLTQEGWRESERDTPSRIEVGERNSLPDAGLLVDLAEELGVSVEEILRV